MMSRALAAALFAGGARAAAVPLATFGGEAGTTFEFKELNDPVMGGQSRGTWHVDASGGYGVLDGEVVDVPSLRAPGFIKVAADGRFPDASSALGGALVLRVRSSTPGYQGFRVSFAAGTSSPAYACAGGGSLPRSRGCFKAKFSAPEGPEFAEVRLPLAAFSDRWSPATGETAATCAEDASACPTAAGLGGILRLELWAEGADGRAHLEVQSISAEPAAVSARPPRQYDACSGAVQAGLRYGISGRTDPDVPVPVDATESLAEAICCDVRTKVYAEPQFLYQAPDVNLFAALRDGATTFYDSVCGLPVFRAPVNRTLRDFEADTDEHGWPSFRTEEVVKEHVRVDADGFVYSSCGTHLGSFLPDDKGSRWCIDLSCIAGNPSLEPLLV